MGLAVMGQRQAEYCGIFQQVACPPTIQTPMHAAHCMGWLSFCASTALACKPARR